MNVVIKGMGMPSSCEDCRFFIKGDSVFGWSDFCMASCKDKLVHRTFVCPLYSVVCCSECKHSDKSPFIVDGYGWCYEFERVVADDFFCGKGAKKDENP